MPTTMIALTRCFLIIALLPALTEFVSAAPEVRPLWPDGAPGAKGNREVDKPTLRIYLPKENANGAGVVVCPGGGYGGLAKGHEGVDIARFSTFWQPGRAACATG